MKSKIEIQQRIDTLKRASQDTKILESALMIEDVKLKRKIIESAEYYLNECQYENVRHCLWLLEDSCSTNAELN